MTELKNLSILNIYKRIVLYLFKMIVTTWQLKSFHAVFFLAAAFYTQLFWTKFIVLYVIIVSCTRFRVDLHSAVAWILRTSCKNRRHIWSLSDSNESWTHNHLVRKRLLNHLAKLVEWLMFVYELSGCGFESCCFHLKFILLNNLVLN